jgi:superfamily II DNA or RNA helicase
VPACRPPAWWATPDRGTPPGAAALASGELCALVTVDLYNEGVDLPMVDTLLLLRPTQSPVLFQQQIGRGLRLAPGKESCLVLDFVGQHRPTSASTACCPA